MVSGGDACTHYQRVNKPHKNEQQLTKTGDEVVENGEEQGFGLEWNVKDGVYCEERRDGEDVNVQPVEVVDNVAPLERRQSFLVFQRP